MTDAVFDPSAGSSPGRQTRAAPRAAVHSPLLDFILLGGGSIPILVALVLMLGEEHRVAVLITVSVLSIFINNPHFMHSYQIFYDNFEEKLKSGARALRLRYAVAGLVVPAAMVLYFAYTAWVADPALLGRAVNLMLFLVGWHYVKQGYGILIVESVFRRRFLADWEKTLFRWNGFAAWIFSWVYGNILIEAAEFRGVEYVTLGLPDWLAWATGTVALATGLATAAAIVRRAGTGRLPINGALGYVSAVYLWLVLASVEPILVLIGPVFHSLQYLAVVWRFQLNKAENREPPGEVAMLSGLVRVSRSRAAMIRFVFLGMVAGALAFWVVPIALDLAIAYREELFGPSMFLFMFIVFINVHHYFMDNVMWRKENPDIREHLFG